MTWRKSSFSGVNTDCVEVAFSSGAVGVRDSKSPTTRLTVPQVAWKAFLREITRSS
jgi:Domain of unknown function (DUF397)